MMRRFLSVLFVVLLVVPLVAGSAVALPETATPTATPQGAQDGSQGDEPTTAERTRVAPVNFNKDYLKVSWDDKESAYQVRGPYAVFATSSDVEAARVQQPGAEATVLDGGRTVQVSFAEDASTGEEASLFKLELFFADGSSTSTPMMVKDTDQFVASAELKDANGLLDDLAEDAEDHGFAPTIEGIEEYHEWEMEQADLFSNLFGPQIEALKAWGILTLFTPAAIILGALVVGLGARRLLKVHGWKLRAHKNNDNLTERKRRELILAYKEQLQAADEERLDDVPEIGSNHVYWSDAYNVYSVKQLADLVAFGKPKTDAEGHILRDDNGNVVWEHRGIADLIEADSMRDTWLEPVLREDMIGSEQSALAQAKRVLLRMTSRYGQSQYRPARAESTALLDRLSTGRGFDDIQTSTSSATSFGGPSPGDD